MKITNIRIHKNTNSPNILGIASIQLDNCLVIHGIRLVQLKDKRVISFPNKKIPKYTYSETGEISTDYEYTDIVHPSNNEFRQYIEEELFKIYDLEEVEK